MRTLGISIENIKKIASHEVELLEMIKNQYSIISNQIEELGTSKAICQEIMNTNELTYDNLNIEMYIPKVKEYIEINHKTFKLDSVSFMYMWGGMLSWGIITTIAMFVALLAYPNLPTQIPIQWSNGMVSNEVGKVFIFAYPIACIIIRFLLRPFIWKWLHERFCCNDVVSDYVTNYLCFTALSIQLFTILYLKGFVKSVSIIFGIDFIVFIGTLLIGWKHSDMKKAKR